MTEFVGITSLFALVGFSLAYLTMIIVTIDLVLIANNKKTIREKVREVMDK